MKKRIFALTLVVSMLLASITSAYAASDVTATDKTNMSKLAWLCHYASYSSVVEENPGHTIIYAPVGSPSNEVKVAQDIMTNSATCGTVSVDGVFGSGTRDAVKLVQGKNSASRDGVVGPATWRYLCAEAKVASRTTGSNSVTVIFCPDPNYTSSNYARTIKYVIQGSSQSGTLTWYYGSSTLILD